jgi:hypothetical protein
MHESGSPATITPARQLHFVLVGPRRAGTTLLRLLLNNHPSIACVGEFEEAVSQVRDQTWPDLAEFCLYLSQDRPFLSKSVTLDASIENYPALIRSIWDQLAARENKPLVGCCIHSRIDRVRDIWPSTKFIFLSRDPRDVTRSCVGMGWAGEPTSAADQWLEPVDRWIAMRDTLATEDFIEVRYEDLLTNPKHELDRCCQLLGHSFDPAMLDFHETSTYEPLDPKLAEQWRRKMPPRIAEIIDATCRDRMSVLGYELSTPNPRPASSSEALRLKIANRIGRFRWRAKRYGLLLTLSWILAKRLHMSNPWRTKLKSRFNAIDTKHLR